MPTSSEIGESLPTLPRSSLAKPVASTPTIRCWEDEVNGHDEDEGFENALKNN
jgi:hypothetical protein